MSDVTPDGVDGVRPGREATTDVNVDTAPPTPTGEGHRRRREGGERPVVPEAEFRSYYGMPVINKPVWESRDIAGYWFLGGLAGASSVVAAAAQLTRRPALARVAKVGATGAAAASAAALVHDLGRPSRFLNMLRVFKPTSPMSVGSWLLAGFGPATGIAALSDLFGVAPAVGAAATAAAAAAGPVVATYTAALTSDTAVPAWHDGYRTMPFVFAASAATSAAGLGLVGAPYREAAPLRRLGPVTGTAELVAMQIMKRRMGLAAESFEEAKPRRYERGAQVLVAAGVGTAVLGGIRGRRAGRARLGWFGRLVSRASGALLLTGSALTRFAIFEAGIASAEDPKYTVVPQRQRLEARRQASPR
jgi:DMSO reductase anchor subunit